jgi:hypothetical protein
MSRTVLLDRPKSHIIIWRIVTRDTAQIIRNPSFRNFVVTESYIVVSTLGLTGLTEAGRQDSGGVISQALK